MNDNRCREPGRMSRSRWAQGHLRDQHAHSKPASPSISVVVCAYTEERWHDIAAAIESCHEQSTAPLETIVVVDHNPALLQRLRSTVQGIVAIENHEAQGLSGARNSGIHTARGEVVAFLDDDAIADPDWLERLGRGYADPSVIGVGGSVAPLWPTDRPRAFPAEFDWVVGCTYRGMPETTSPVRNMIGANMSLRRDLFAEIGGFRTGIGRIGKRPLGCEETELCIRARQRWPEATILFEPSARVRHRVTPERIRWSYFRARCYAEGLSKVMVASHTGSRDGLASERTYALHALPLGVLRGVRDTLTLGDLAGIARAGAIVAGLGITIVGYAAGRWSTRKDGGGA
ncbi:MAG: glucosyl-dolichyl phosphate glucuronosyltransferase [Solirubrobacteraceae bacterium]|jgi:GT2 family glycosyltransferase|nr:glucosyl-dolichyl phosphate glucuronosyltransferase [Solirubrobacteraceae bacterium]MEA2184883.1 glucosyl-dolichyl phosphate glucuronosyltransferase [Solirubrobacteraceae bacterium]MEA2186978.1 glucosyl-dolichyl phosphate glucuronosyltransferase [Solirubrobacteraceae bacterium]